MKNMKINEVACRYNITKRTLRYYEEIGLMKSRRGEYSNYRSYDDEDLKRLEQILLLHGIGFNLKEIGKILLSNDDETISNIFQNKLNELQHNIDDLTYFQNVVSSIIKIRSEQGREKINFHEVLKEQVYVNKKLERVIETSQYVGETIIVEFGINICDCARKLIEEIKKLRPELENTYKKEIPLMRIRDIDNLAPDEYRIIIKGIIVENDKLCDEHSDSKAMKLLYSLKKAIISNIENI